MTKNRLVNSDATLVGLEKQIGQMSVAGDDLARVALQRQLIAARTERNALVPLTQLSPELVRRVFELLQEPLPSTAMPKLADVAKEADDEWESDDDESDDSREPKEPELPFLLDGWMAFANACTWTRAMAVAFPDLWTRIDCSSGERAVRSAERAGDVALILSMPPEADGSAMAFLAEHFLRARELVYHEPTLIEEERLHEQRFVEQLNGSCPRLEKLKLIDYRAYGNYLTGKYDSLRSLILEDGEYCPTTSKTTLHLPSLCALTLHSLYIDDGIFSLMDLLRSLPTLEDLQLIDLDNSTRSPQSIRDLDDDIDLDDDTWKVTLPNLQRLVVKSDLRTVAVFIRILPLPSTHLDLVVTSNDHEDGSSGVGEHLDPFYEHEIVSRARTFWKAASERDRFDEGTFRADLDMGDHWVTWEGSQSGRTVRVSTPLDPEASIAVHDCTVLEWVHPDDQVWEPMGDHGPVLTGVRKVVIKRGVEFFPRGPKNLKTWLRTQREAGRKIDTVEFVKCPPHEQRGVWKALKSLGVKVTWSP